MSWDYAKLSKMAKENGGPAALVEKLFQDGVSQGKKSMYPVVIVVLLVGATAWEGGKWIWKKIRLKLGKNPSEDEIRMVKEELIQGINDYNAAHEDEDSSEDEDEE